MEAGCKRFVDLEGVCWCYFLGFGQLHQDPLAVLAHGQGQQCPHQISLWDHGFLEKNYSDKKRTNMTISSGAVTRVKMILTDKSKSAPIRY